MGTIGIVAIYNIISKNAKGIILNNILLTISANILIIPITIYYFNIISVNFIFSNLLLSPLICIAIIVGFITIIIAFISIKIAKIPALFLNIILTITIKIAKFFAKLKTSKIYLTTPNLVIIIIYYIIVAMVLYNIKNKSIKKYLKIFFIIILIISIIIKLPYWKNDDLTIYFIDVGQGDSTLIITPQNKTILIDGGGSSSNSYNIGEQILIPYLLDRKIKKIDYMLISHFDSDHCQGCIRVIEELKVKNIIIGKQYKMSDNYKEFIEIVKKKNIKVNVVEAREKIGIESGIYFDILWPFSENVINENILNNNSVVCKLFYEKTSILFTGDIEEIAEKEIMEKYKNKKEILRANILKVAHHGSKTSSSEEFINIVKPKIALIGVGKENKFGHPNNIVLERLKRN